MTKLEKLQYELEELKEWEPVESAERIEILEDMIEAMQEDESIDTSEMIDNKDVIAEYWQDVARGLK